MKMNIRKSLSLILTVLMLVTMLPLSVFASENAGIETMEAFIDRAVSLEAGSGLAVANKVVTEVSDGVFQVDLYVAGQNGIPKAYGIDVVFVVDTSGSMSSTDITNARNAVRDSIDALFKTSVGEQCRAAVVVFNEWATMGNFNQGGTGGARYWTTKSEWATMNGNTFNDDKDRARLVSTSTNNNQGLTGGNFWNTANRTNTQAGIHAAHYLLNNLVPKTGDYELNTSVIVVMTDGGPNKYYGQSNGNSQTNNITTQYTGYTNTNRYVINKTVAPFTTGTWLPSSGASADGDATSQDYTIAQAKYAAADKIEIYSIGYGNKFSSNTSVAYRTLHGIGINGFYTVAGTAVTEMMKNITEGATIRLNDIKVEDMIGNGFSIKGTITQDQTLLANWNANGGSGWVTVPQGTTSQTWAINDNQLTWSLGSVESNFLYRLSFQIEINSNAPDGTYYTNTSTASQFVETPGAEGRHYQTGDHNKMTYSFDGKAGDTETLYACEKYEKSSFKPVTITVKKTVSGEGADNRQFTFKLLNGTTSVGEVTINADATGNITLTADQVKSLLNGAEYKDLQLKEDTTNSGGEWTYDTNEYTVRINKTGVASIVTSNITPITPNNPVVFTNEFVKDPEDATINVNKFFEIPDNGYFEEEGYAKGTLNCDIEESDSSDAVYDDVLVWDCDEEHEHDMDACAYHYEQQLVQDAIIGHTHGPECYEFEFTFTLTDAEDEDGLAVVKPVTLTLTGQDIIDLANGKDSELVTFFLSGVLQPGDGFKVFNIHETTTYEGDDLVLADDLLVTVDVYGNVTFGDATAEQSPNMNNVFGGAFTPSFKFGKIVVDALTGEKLATFSDYDFNFVLSDESVEIPALTVNNGFAISGNIVLSAYQGVDEAALTLTEDAGEQYIYDSENEGQKLGEITYDDAVYTINIADGKVVSILKGETEVTSILFVNSYLEYQPGIILDKDYDIEGEDTEIVAGKTEVTYMLTVTNNGEEALGNIVIEDTFFNVEDYAAYAAMIDETIAVTDSEGNDIAFVLEGGKLTLTPNFILAVDDSFIVTYSIIPTAADADLEEGLRNDADVSGTGVESNQYVNGGGGVPITVTNPIPPELGVVKEVKAYTAGMDLTDETGWANRVSFATSGNRAAFKVTITNNKEDSEAMYVTDITDFFGLANAQTTLEDATFIYDGADYAGLGALLEAISGVALYYGDGEIVFYYISGALSTVGTFTNTVTVTATNGDEVLEPVSDSATVPVSFGGGGGGGGYTPSGGSTPPADEPPVDLPEDIIPLASIPATFEEPEEFILVDEEIPLALPKTGGMGPELPLAAGAVLALGIGILLKGLRKEEDAQ